MASEGPERASQAPSLTSLPRVEDLPSAADGFDREKVREAFEAFRRHTTQLQVQLRVLQAAGQGGSEPTGHAVRMDAMHMIRAAAEMADTIERDAQTASAAQLRRTEEEVSRRQRELQERQGDVDKYRQESERQRAEMLERRQERGAQDDPGRRAAGRAGDRRGGVSGGQAARAGPAPGDRAHELDARRGRADARVGARPGRSDHQPRAGRRGAAAGRRRSRRRGDRPRRDLDRQRRAGRRRIEPRHRSIRRRLRARSCESPRPKPSLSRRASPSRRSRRSRRPRHRRTKTTRPARLGPCCRAASDSALRSRRCSSCCSRSARGSPT